MCHVSVIVVNTNTRDLVCRCIDSIYANAPKCEFEIIVVDNASTDRSCEEIELRYPAVRLIRNSRNVGFSVANNYAFEIALGEHLLLLNSDTIVLPESLDRLLSALHEDRKVGIVAPKLIYPDGSLQMSYGPMPDLFVTCCSFFDVKRWIPRSLVRRIGRSTANRVLGKGVSSYVKWFSGDTPRTTKLGKHMLVTGACMLIRGECFKQVGPLDPTYFMYADDADYCKRVHDAGWEIQYVAEASIIHIKGGTVGEKYRWASPAPYYSVFYFLRKHRGRGVSQVARAMAVASLALRFLVKVVVAPSKALESWELLRKVAADTECSGATNR